MIADLHYGIEWARVFVGVMLSGSQHQVRNGVVHSVESKCPPILRFAQDDNVALRTPLLGCQRITSTIGRCVLLQDIV
jgi:hypothetical protein